MRASLSCLVLLASVMASPAFAIDIPVDSIIKAATVYNDRATITRRATVDIPAGAHTLVFKNLPVTLFTDSLHADGKATGKVTFGAVTFKQENSEDFVVPKEKELMDKLLLLQDSRQNIEAEKQALVTGKTFLDNLGKQAVLRANEDIAEINLKPEVWAAAAESLQTKIAENLKATLAQDVALRKIDDEIQKNQNDLDQLRTGQKQTMLVEVPIESPTATSLTVELQYQEPEVGWQPVYDARFDTKTGVLALVQYGAIWQRTGEDWTDIDLTLSTAQPSRGTGLPDLPPQWVSLMDANYGAQGIGSAGGTRADFETNATGMVAMAPAMKARENVVMDSAMPVPEQEVAFTGAQIDSQGFVGEYHIVGPSTVTSDGTQSKVLVGTFDTDTIMQVQIKPQISTEAYLVVKTTLKGDSPILPGPVNLFRDTAYIGQTVLPMLRPNDIQELAFGVDDKVTVKRNVLKDERSETGLVIKDQVIEKQFTTDIQNLHKEDIAIAVLETVPVSQDQKIRSEILTDITTAGYESDLHDVKGLMRWLVTVKPEEKKKVTLGWRVSWPKDQSLSGL